MQKEKAEDQGHIYPRASPHRQKAPFPDAEREERFSPEEQALFANMIRTLVDTVPDRTADL